jgi:rhamnosyltransferase
MQISRQYRGLVFIHLLERNLVSMPRFSTCAVIVPTLNAAKDLSRCVPSLLAAIPAGQVMVIDSSSGDGTADFARAVGFRVHSISRSEFNHGGTRQLAIDLLPEAELVIFLTQDAILADSDALRVLLEPFSDPQVAAVFGRQLPRPEAGPIEAHARLFNYPSESSIRTVESREVLGFKAIFLSNSFAAYRREALVAVGGFPTDVIFGEDTITAANFLLAGWKIAYVAEAKAYHSHGYTWRQDFKRYFDIGVLHSRESWLLEEFGQTSGEGRRFVVSELTYLWHHSWWLIPSSLIRTALKLIGYRLGRIENKLSLEWKRKLSMHRSFWT